MDHFPLWYRRAAEHPSGSFIYSIPFEETSGNLHVIHIFLVELSIHWSEDCFLAQAWSQILKVFLASTSLAGFMLL